MKLWRESLKFKVAAAIAAMLVLVLGVGTWINLSLFSDEYLAWSQARAEVMAKPLIQRIHDLLSQVGDNPSAFIVLSGDIHLLMKENPEVSRVAIFDRSGKLATDSDKDVNKNLDANARIQRIIETKPQRSVTLPVGGNYYALIPIKHEKQRSMRRCCRVARSSRPPAREWAELFSCSPSLPSSFPASACILSFNIGFPIPCKIFARSPPPWPKGI